MIDRDVRPCRKCKRSLPEKSFFIRTAQKSGRSTICRECEVERVSYLVAKRNLKVKGPLWVKAQLVVHTRMIRI